MSDLLSFDLDELDNDDDDEFLRHTNDLGFTLSNNTSDNELQSSLYLSNSNNATNNEPLPTLESILNEDDDEENDEILKSLTSTLTTLELNNKTKNDSIDIKSSSNRSSILNMTKDSSSRSSSFNHVTYSALTEKNGIVCKQTQLKQISTQLLTAIERSDSGLATCLTVGQLIAVGTSRGLILLFDVLQILKLYITTDFKEAICALSLNNSCDRLLAGNAVGHIFMFDTTNGKLLRQITEAHPYGNAILNLKFTDDSKLACFSDSGGSVFMLEFKRVMGVRSADSTCLFSGSRGEVCCIEPLRFEKFAESIVDKLSLNSIKTSSTAKRNLENVSVLFNRYSLLAMASFTKIFVVSLKPKLTVLFTFPLTGNPKYLPIISWQFVIIQKGDNKRYVTPILACARESTIHFFQVDYVINRNNEPSPNKTNEKNSAIEKNSNNDSNNNNQDQNNTIQFKFTLLQKLDFKYKIYNFCWLNAKTISILDHTEKLHICDIKSQEELQIMSNLNECVQLVFNSCFFKSLATGGYVSKALAYAGENACYQTFQSYLGQLFMLGTKSVTLFSLQAWSSRIDDFVNDNALDLALNLSLSMYKGETKALIGLPIDSNLRKEKIVDKIIDILYLYINRAMKQDCPTDGKLDVLAEHYKKCSSKCVNVCITIKRQDLLFDNLYNLLNIDRLFEGYFFESLEDYILDNKLDSIPPSIIQNFIDYYSSNLNMLDRLEKCLLHFDIGNLDLHNVIQLCRKYSMLDAYIHLFNKAFNDYVTPLEEMITMMQPHLFLIYDIAKEHLSKNSHDTKLTTYGNKLLVYIHSCLCGQSYPFGKIEDDQLSDRVRHTTFDYLISKRNKLIDKIITNEKENNGSKSLLAKYFDDLLNESISNAGCYPIIRILLNYDISSFLNVISMTFNEPSFEAVIGLDKKQQLIDILIEISLKSSSSSSYVLSDQLIGHFFTFLARQIANKNNNIEIDNQIFAQIIEYLCNMEEIDRAEEREQTLLYLLNSYSLQIVEKFNLDRLLNLAKNAKFYRVCEILFELRGEFYEIVDCYLNKENSLERQKRVFDVTRNLLDILYESNNNTKTSTGNHQQHRNSLITSPNMNLIMSNNNNGNTTKRMRSFSHIQQMYAQQSNLRKMSIGIEPRDVQLRKLQEKLIRKETLTQMISINPTETIHLLWVEMNIDLKFLIKSIQSHIKTSQPKVNLDDDNDNEENDSSTSPKSIDKSIESSNLLDNYEDDRDRLLYKFIKGLFDLAELIKIDRKYINYMSQFSPEYCELYVDLICYYEPDKLLYFLKTILNDYSYRVDECLRICRARKVWDGAAYLLEKSGQIEAAFSLNIEKVNSLIKDLQKKLEQMSQKELDSIKSNIDAMVIAIVQLCQRNSCSLNDSVKEKIWFSLFHEVMKPVGSLFIDPAIEKLLEFDSSQENIKQRLNETKEFFKNLGSFIINSMVGYLNLTIIIDRIICDPLYGPSNLGDIKDLMLKMLEMCSYEHTLLTKTSNLVSKDVYYKMASYKRLCSKSYSPFTDYCLYCSRSFDLANLDENYESSSLNEKSLVIYHCGHSFHQICLDIIQTKKESSCPICTSSNMELNGKHNPTKAQLVNKAKNTNKLANKLKIKQMSQIMSKDDDFDNMSASEMMKKISLNDSSNMEINSKLSPVSSVKQTKNNTLENNASFNLQLSDQQIAMLKSIRTRNQSYSKMMLTNYKVPNYNYDVSLNENEVVQTKTALKLAPANIIKYL